MMEHATALKALACLLLFEGSMSATSHSQLNGCYNTDVMLSCPYYTQNKPGKLVWRFYDKTVSKWAQIASIRNGNLKVTSANTALDGRSAIHPNGSLEITSLHPDDETQYLCIVKQEGRNLHVVKLSVTCGALAKPDVVQQTGCRDKDVILNCPDFNETQSTVTLRWEVQDQTIASITNGKIWLNSTFQGRLTLYPNGSLKITSLKDEDESEYICIVQKRPITQLHVKSKGCALAKPDVVQQTGCRDKGVILNCPDFNETQSTVTLRWEVQDQKIASITNGKIWLTKKPKFQGRLTLYLNGSLKITSLKDGDESKYICIVQKKAITQLQVKSKECHSSNISRQVCIEEVVLLDCQAKHRTDPQKIKELKWTKKSESGDWWLVPKLNKSPGVLSSKVQQLVNGSLLLPRGRDVGKDTYKCSVDKHDGEQTETHVVYVKNRRCTSIAGIGAHLI